MTATFDSIFDGIKYDLDRKAREIGEEQQQRWTTIRVLKNALAEIAALSPKSDDHSGRLAVKIAEDVLRETGDWPHA